jgi:hypothetical protein
MAEALLADLPTPGPDGQSATEATACLEPAPVPAVYGDSAYGTGQVLAHLDQHGITAMTKVPPLHAPDGRFAKDRFTIDLADRTVTCPARRTVAITPRSGGAGWPALAAPARCARWPPSAPPAAPGARSASTATRRCWPRPAPGSKILPGGRTTARPAQRWSASWRTCCAAATVGGAPACAGCYASARTSGYWLPRSTSPASPPSASATDRAAGRRRQRSSKTMAAGQHGGITTRIRPANPIPNHLRRAPANTHWAPAT